MASVSEKFEQVDRTTWIKNSVTLIKADELSATVSENRWKQMVAWVVESTDLQLPSVESLLKDLWVDVEGAVLEEFFGGCKRKDLESPDKKKRFHEKTAWYRSNKSVIKKAVSLGVDMLDSERMPKAKSALEAECRTAQQQYRVELTPLQKFTIAITSAKAIALNIEDEADRRAARAMVQGLFNTLT